MTDSGLDATGNNDYMLTTYDNPFDPFTQWDQWYAWDEAAGYCTCGLLDRIARVSNEMAPVDYYTGLDRAMDEIVTENVSGMHTKIKRGDGAVGSTSG